MTSVSPFILVSLLINISNAYIGVSTRYNWFQADDYCLTNYGSHLATIISSNDQSLASSVCLSLSGSYECWIGLNDIKNPDNYVWIGNETHIITFTNWQNNDPDASGSSCIYIYIYKSNGEWEDVGCTGSHYFICNDNNTAVEPSSLGYIGHSFSYSFFDADDYCYYNHQSHLATINTEPQMYEVSNICRGLGSNKECWIGINKFPGSTQWIWISDLMSASYTNWYIGDPSITSSSLLCGAIEQIGAGFGRYWVDPSCTTNLNSFVCDPANSADAPSSKGYIGNAIYYNWFDAEDHCLYYYQSRLATIFSESQNNEAANVCRDLATNKECWIGLKKFSGVTEYSWK